MRTEQHSRPPTGIVATREASLRNATRDLHRELDQLVSALDLSSAHDYRRYLQANASALLALETLLESSNIESLLGDWPSRQRRAAIVADLQRLDLEARPMELRRKAPTPAELLGMVYVLERTRLDAPPLLARALASSDPIVREASSYLTASDPDLWQTFVEDLESDPATADQAQTVAGAIYAFTIFIRAFEHG